MSSENQAAIDLAQELARRLSDIVPDDISVSAHGNWLSCVPRDDPEGYVDMEVCPPPKDDASDDLFVIRIEAILGGVQDCIIKAQSSGWPGVRSSDPASMLPEPFATLEADNLGLGYKSPDVNMELPPIDLAALGVAEEEW